MEATVGTESAEQMKPANAKDGNSQLIQDQYGLRRNGRFISRLTAKRIANLHKRTEKSSEQREKPLEPPEPWTRCRLRQNRVPNPAKVDVKCEVFVKEENISDTDETSCVINETNISQECRLRQNRVPNPAKVDVKCEVFVKEENISDTDETSCVINETNISQECRLRQNRVPNPAKVDVKCVVFVKEENISDTDETSCVINETSISQESVIADISSVKMETEDEFPEQIQFIECQPVKMEEELHLIDETELLEDSNPPTRRTMTECTRLANKTAEQRARRLEYQRWYRERNKFQRLQRLATETEEQRSTRLERKQMYKLKARAKWAEVSQEEREQRKERRKKWRSKLPEEIKLRQRMLTLIRLAGETEEQRSTRLANQRVSRLKWQAKLPEERKIGIRMAQLRRLATESEEEKWRRLERGRLRYQERKIRKALRQRQRLVDSTK